MYYYAKADGERVGPVSREELQRAAIDKNTFVWRAGMEEWMRAGDMYELRDFFGGEALPDTPPPIPHYLLDYQPAAKKRETESAASSSAAAGDTNSADEPEIERNNKRQMTIAGIGVGLLIAVIITVVVLNYNKTKGDTDDSSDEVDSTEIQRMEMDSASKFLDAQVSFSHPTLSSLTVEGKIFSKAKVATYHQADLDIQCLDGKEKVLKSYEKTLTDTFAPGQFRDFKFTLTKVPKDAKTYTVTIKSAK